MQQIVICKGWGDLVNRLIAVMHCINYCLKHNAIICVDWRDEGWGNAEEDFYDYFEVRNIPQMSINELMSIEKKDIKFHPEYWTLEKTLCPLTNDTARVDYCGSINDKYDRIDADVVVINSMGFKAFDLHVGLIRIGFTKKIQPEIIKHLDVLNAPYTAIYLKDEDVNEATNSKALITLLKKYPPHMQERIYIVTDMPELAKFWFDAFNEVHLIKVDGPVNSLSLNMQNIHALSKEELLQYNVTKRDLNIKIVVDFVAFSYGNWKFGTHTHATSNWTHFVARWGPGAISEWMDGYMPVSKSFSSKYKA